MANKAKTLKQVDGKWVTFCWKGHPYIPISRKNGRDRCKLCIDEYIATDRARHPRKGWNFSGDPTPKPNACEICHTIAQELCRDHSYKTGVFRGWLCHGCNLRLGWLEKVGVNKVCLYISKHELEVDNGASG